MLKAFQIENIILYLEKKENDVHNLKKITKYKKVILKAKQRFKSERHNVFNEAINKIDLSQMTIKQCNQLI